MDLLYLSNTIYYCFTNKTKAMTTSPNNHGQGASPYEKVNYCRSNYFINDDEAPDKHIKDALIQRSWFEVRDKLRKKFPQLTEEDVSYAPGEKCKMMRALEEKLEISPAKLQRIIARL